MANRDDNIEKVRKFLISGAEIPHDLMLAALNQATDTSSSDRRREVVSSISENAGKYLESWALLDFVGADIDDEYVAEIIAKRKALTSRFSMLLPSISALFKIERSRHASSIIAQIYDCCRDYPTVEKSQYSTQQRKKIVREINTVIGLAEQLAGALETAKNHLDIEYSQHKDAAIRMGVKSDSLFDIDAVRFELQTLRFSSQLALYRDEVGERSFYVGDNKARTHIVECAYRMALRCGAPIFKTTPGSDFSTVCSLIFELATGISDESLAGAINKFARSDLRQEIDSDQVITNYENSDIGMAEREADNFTSVRESIAQFEADAIFWRKMLSSRQWDDMSKYQISLRFLDVLEQKEMSIKRHGPFQVWASQISEKDIEEFRAKSDRYESQILEAAIARGKSRRAKDN